MADLDLLRDINNTYGHLAGDAVLRGISEVSGSSCVTTTCRRDSRRRVLDPASGDADDQAYEIADRIRRQSRRDSSRSNSSEPIRDDLDGVSPDSARRERHERARPPGRSRRLPRRSSRAATRCSTPPTSRCLRSPRSVGAPRLPAGPAERARTAAPPATELIPEVERARLPAAQRPRSAVLLRAEAPRTARRPRRPARHCGGLAAAIFGHSQDVVGLVTIIVLVGLGQVLSLEWRRPARSPSAPSARSLQPRSSALVRRCACDHDVRGRVECAPRRLPSAALQRRRPVSRLAGRAAIFAVHISGQIGTGIFVASGLLAGLVYMVVNMGLVSIAVGVEGRESRCACSVSGSPGWPALRRVRLRRRRHLRGLQADRSLGDRRLALPLFLMRRRRRPI